MVHAQQHAVQLMPWILLQQQLCIAATRAGLPAQLPLAALCSSAPAAGTG